MKCPFCSNKDTKVIDSRSGKIEFEIRRRRECPDCSRRFTTFERLEQIPLIIVKKDNRREEFNSEKIFIGIKKACEKRPVSIDRIQAIVDKIEQELRESGKNEIPSMVIGEKIMQFLKKTDDMAYVRFASVYREFKDLADYIQELKELIPENYLTPEFKTVLSKISAHSKNG
jgi:transcriptional repressor NrdR